MHRARVSCEWLHKLHQTISLRLIDFKLPFSFSISSLTSAISYIHRHYFKNFIAFHSGSYSWDNTPQYRKNKWWTKDNDYLFRSRNFCWENLNKGKANQEGDDAIVLFCLFFLLSKALKCSTDYTQYFMTVLPSKKLLRRMLLAVLASSNWRAWFGWKWHGTC